MNVLVDTPVWSIVLRRRVVDLNPDQITILDSVTELTREGRIMMIGPIRQELLSGLREPAQFNRLRDFLRAFKDEDLRTLHYETAAQMTNLCRSHGIATTSVDMLICAVASLSDSPVFTIDKDYLSYSRILPVRLFA